MISSEPFQRSKHFGSISEHFDHVYDLFWTFFTIWKHPNILEAFLDVSEETFKIQLFDLF